MDLDDFGFPILKELPDSLKNFAGCTELFEGQHAAKRRKVAE